MDDRPDLSVSGLTKRFGGVVAVADASLAVATGAIHGLIGPNGAGKSTVINLLSGTLRPDQGEIRFGSHDLTRLDPSAIARLGISRTFQQATPLVGLTVLENVMVGMHMHHRATLGGVLLRLPAMRREARAIAAAAHRLLDQFDLQQEAATDAGALTFGKLRFLDLARALATRPRMLLLDEPAAGLNKPETETLARLVRGFRQDGLGVLLVDHDVPFVFDLCDHITVMNFGSIIAAGTPAEIHRNQAVREAYLGDPAAQEQLPA